MSTSSKWSLSKEEQNKYIAALSLELAPLRAKIGISQGELAYLVGISRQTYSAVESGKRDMSWSTYLALILFFDYNQATHQMIRNIGVFPDEMIERFNSGENITKYNYFLGDDKLSGEVVNMLQSLDPQGLHAMKTVLMLEYGRCKDQGDKPLNPQLKL